MARSSLTRDSATRHPCWQVAFFLPRASRPPDVCSLHLARPRQGVAQVASNNRAFVSTRAGTDTMARGGQDANEDDIMEAGDSTFSSASRAPGRSHHLLCLLTSAQLSPLPTHSARSCLEITALLAVEANCKLTVKDAGNLLFLRDWIFEELGPPSMWIIMLSVVEWDTLTTEQKELNTTMCVLWIFSYNKASHTVLPHWVWKFLKDKTKGFAPLRKVFAKIKVNSLDSGTNAWREIFLLYPVIGASIVCKLLARGLRTCLGFKDDSTAAATDYIASINGSASQLSHMQPMTVPDVYALVTLMLSWSSTSLKPPRRPTKSFSPTLTTVMRSRLTRCKTRSSGSLVLA